MNSVVKLRAARNHVLADAHLSMDEWIQLSRVNRVATTLFSRDRRAADAWGRWAWVKWQYEGIQPEDLVEKPKEVFWSAGASEKIIAMRQAH